MKKRQGFVSNSSSSSFVLKKGEGFNDTREIAKYMLPDIDWLDVELRNKYFRILDTLNEDENIMFHSTNYDTFIQYLNGYYFVDTANNHDWGNKLNDGHVNDLPEEFDGIVDKEYLYCGEHDIIDDSAYEVDFFSLPYGIHYTRLHWENSKYPYETRYCKDKGHYSEKILVDGQLFCPQCEGELGRKLKIKKLLDNK